MLLSSTTVHSPSNIKSSSSQFDLDDYHAIEEVAQVASSSEVSPIKNQSQNNEVGKDIPRTRTFSSGLISNFDALELEYDTFTGSVGGSSVPKDVDHSIASLDSTNDTEHDSTLNSVGSEAPILNSTSLQQDTLPELTVGKTRMKNFNSQIDFHKIANMTRIPSQFTVTKVSEDHSDVKLKKLDKQFNYLSDKIKKIEIEIKFLDNLMPDISSQMVHSIEAAKLRLARDKLFDKCEQLKKQKYELSIKMNNKFKNVYGVNGADKAQYWVRGVSS